MFFVAFFWAFFDASLFPGELKQVARSEHTGGVWPPVGIDLRPLRPALPQHDDPAALGLHGDLGAPRADPRRPQGPAAGPGADRPARRPVHRDAGLRIQPRAFGFTGGIYPSTFYMATGFHGFHVIVGTIFLASSASSAPVIKPATSRPGTSSAFRLRGGGLVLALRRRGVAVLCSSRRHLLVGQQFRHHASDSGTVDYGDSGDSDGRP
jgi:hypothetical protein